MPFKGEQLNRVWYIHSMEYDSAIKKEQTMDTHNNLDDPPKNYAKWQTAIPKAHMLHVSIYITFFLKFYYYLFYLFIFGCIGSLLLCAGFL